MSRKCLIYLENSTSRLLLFLSCSLSLSPFFFPFQLKAVFITVTKTPLCYRKLHRETPQIHLPNKNLSHFPLQYHISSNRHGFKDIWDQVFIFICDSEFAETRAPGELSYISFRCWASGPKVMWLVRVKVKLDRASHY